ncbi:MAG: DUF3617 family protein [Terriglobales bacterium]
METAMAARGGMPSNNTITSKGCLTEADLTTNPFHPNDPSGKVQCNSRVLNSTSSDAELEVNCTGEIEMTYHMKFHAVDSEHALGSGEGSATMGGHTMKTSMQSEMKWIGATCPKAGQ